MKNTERQKSLDKKKWLASENKGKDMSGKMDYCMYCKNRLFGVCPFSYDDRANKCICATAYNRMIRENNKG